MLISVLVTVTSRRSAPLKKKRRNNACITDGFQTNRSGNLRPAKPLTNRKNQLNSTLHLYWRTLEMLPRHFSPRNSNVNFTYHPVLQRILLRMLEFYAALANTMSTCNKLVKSKWKHKQVVNVKTIKISDGISCSVSEVYHVQKKAMKFAFRQPTSDKTMWQVQDNWPLS